MLYTGKAVQTLRIMLPEPAIWENYQASMPQLPEYIIVFHVQWAPTKDHPRENCYIQVEYFEHSKTYM